MVLLCRLVTAKQSSIDLDLQRFIVLQQTILNRHTVDKQSKYLMLADTNVLLKLGVFYILKIFIHTKLYLFFIENVSLLKMFLT